jgi:hypothetical protein
VEALVRGRDVVQRECDLIRAVPEMEVINGMVGSVKLSMPGLQNARNAARKSKKVGGN